MYAAFVFAIVLSEEGDLVVQHYDHDTRPENLHSLHTFSDADAAVTFLDEMVRPLMRERVDPAHAAALLERVAEGLRKGMGPADTAILDAVIAIENSRSVLLGMVMGEPEAPSLPATVVQGARMTAPTS